MPSKTRRALRPAPASPGDHARVDPPSPSEGAADPAAGAADPAAGAPPLAPLDELRAILHGPQTQALEARLARLETRQRNLRRTLQAQSEARQARLLTALNSWKQRQSRRLGRQITELAAECQRLTRRLDRQARQVSRLRRRCAELGQALAAADHAAGSRARRAKQAAPDR